jgi:hypothetical protein
MRNSNTIKNLSIALEALSRIPDSVSLSLRVHDLLDKALFEDENPTPSTEPVKNHLDNEIPF